MAVYFPGCEGVKICSGIEWVAIELQCWRFSNSTNIENLQY